jgi:hypothetical protein
MHHTTHAVLQVYHLERFHVGGFCFQLFLPVPYYGHFDGVLEPAFGAEASKSVRVIPAIIAD